MSIIDSPRSHLARSAEILCFAQGGERILSAGDGFALDEKGVSGVFVFVPLSTGTAATPAAPHVDGSPRKRQASDDALDASFKARVYSACLFISSLLS